MVRTANIRALKDHLSSYLRDVQRGDVVLVSDRGRLVAEIRPATHGSHVLGDTDAKLDRLAEQGLVRKGLLNRADAYRPSGLRLAARTIEAALAQTREEL